MSIKTSLPSNFQTLDTNSTIGNTKTSFQSVKIVKCIICNRILTPGLSLAQHIANRHSSDRNDNGVIRPTILKRRPTEANRDLNVNERIFQCCSCSYVSRSSSNRNRHEKVSAHIFIPFNQIPIFIVYKAKITVFLYSPTVNIL